MKREDLMKHMSFREFVERIQENDEVQISKNASRELKRHLNRAHAIDKEIEDRRMKGLRYDHLAAERNKHISAHDELKAYAIRDAKKRLQKEESEVNEISDGAMDRYSAKASRELDGGKRNKRLAGISLVQAKKHRKYGGASGEGDAMDTADYTRKVRNRGARMAEETVNELSTEKLKKYVAKVKDESEDKGLYTDDGKTYEKRRIGLSLARKRGVKEERIDEISKDIKKAHAAYFDVYARTKNEEVEVDEAEVSAKFARAMWKQKGAVRKLHAAQSAPHEVDRDTGAVRKDLVKAMRKSAVRRMSEEAVDETVTWRKKRSEESMLDRAHRRIQGIGTVKDKRLEKEAMDHAQKMAAIRRAMKAKKDVKESEQVDEGRGGGASWPPKKPSRLEDKIRSHPAVDDYTPNYGEHFVNLKKGYHWSGQRAFGAETAREAWSLLKGVEKGHVDESAEVNEISRQLAAKYAQRATMWKYDKQEVLNEPGREGVRKNILSKWKKRSVGIDRAEKRVAKGMDESTEVNETSIKKAADYYKKNLNWRADLDSKLGDESHPRSEMGWEVSDRERRGLDNRHDGARRALKRILRNPKNIGWVRKVNREAGVDESTEVNELSIEKMKAYKAAALKQGAAGYGHRPKDEADAKRSFKRSKGIYRADRRIEDSTPLEHEPKVHDLRHMKDDEVYNHSQVNDKIKDGDVFHLHGNRVGMMYKAWPTMLHGKSEHLHTFKKGPPPRYKATVDKAAALHKSFKGD